MANMSIRSQALLVVSLAMLTGCSTVHVPTLPAGFQPAPAGLSNELRASVEKLATDIGERNCYRTNALEQAATWIERQLAEAGLTPRRLPVTVPEGPPFDCRAMTVWNIEAERRGTTRPNEVIVIGAHYDTKVATPSWLGFGSPIKDARGTPGADDNASGVAAMLTLARWFADQPTQRTIRFVAFVNEEPPFFKTDTMGSRVYARQCRAATNETVIGMISLETMGCYSAQPHHKRFWFADFFGLPANPDYVAFLSDCRSRHFARKCAAKFQRHAPLTVRTLALPRLGSLVGWSDDWSFWHEGIPAFSVTDTAFLRHDHYHELSDTAEKLDYTTMADVVWGLRYATEELANSCN